MNTTHKTEQNSEIINTTNNQGAWREMKITHTNYFEKDATLRLMIRKQTPFTKYQLFFSS